ncbi:hypothetical protein CEXT_482761 [Caerostris extrusa]|uniref:Uncharacterized protein n=1 Tax=Caerostris extrusa TaxID=172846 RepID=A0AAV4N769_CAEEX|nr:hypothetical protein CEXT_482761 [Caerostris extrusa]
MPRVAQKFDNHKSPPIRLEGQGNTMRKTPYVNPKGIIKNFSVAVGVAIFNPGGLIIGHPTFHPDWASYIGICYIHTFLEFPGSMIGKHQQHIDRNSAKQNE